MEWKAKLDVQRQELDVIMKELARQINLTSIEERAQREYYKNNDEIQKDINEYARVLLQLSLYLRSRYDAYTNMIENK